MKAVQFETHPYKETDPERDVSPEWNSVTGLVISNCYVATAKNKVILQQSPSTYQMLLATEPAELPRSKVYVT